MKLLNCTECHDLKKLQGEWRKCACGRAAARYLKDGRSAQVWGSARILGLDSGEYGRLGSDRTFRPSLFVIEESSPRIQRIKNI